MTDTDGIFDRCCICGYRARPITNGGRYGVECSECANSIDLFETKSEAMVQWNREQRERRCAVSDDPNICCRCGAPGHGYYCECCYPYDEACDFAKRETERKMIDVKDGYEKKRERLK